MNRGSATDVCRSDIEEEKEKFPLRVYPWDDNIRAASTRYTSVLVPQQISRFGDWLETGLGAEFAKPIPRIVVWDGSVVHAGEQMVAEWIQMVFRVGAAVAKKCTTRDREPEMVSKQPAIFLRVNDEFRLVRDALGPCYCVRAGSR